MSRRPPRPPLFPYTTLFRSKEASGQFIAIFDADFIPSRDFLMRTLPYFETDEKVGMVQARWGHINQDYSLLTKIQSILLDRKSTRLNSSHSQISYAVFCLKK